MEIAIFDNFDKLEARKYAEQATIYLLEKGVKCHVKHKLYDKFENKIKSDNLVLIDDNTVVDSINFILTFGGDGTMLAAVKKYLAKDVPIMGFNVGKLGFLAEYSVVNVEKEIDSLLRGEYKLIERTLLETNYCGETITALNDFVVEKKDFSKMITLKVYSNDMYVGDYRADGLIITTPTGSTAYSLSCGGPLICPNANVFCITPISPHALTLRPLVVPAENSISIRVFSPTNEAIMTADGQSLRVVKSGEMLDFYQSTKHVKIVVPTDSTYFDIIRKKMLWAEYSFGK
ncbi:MAG: hypothetical protein GX372_06435 [Ignavibacteria bacterium]|jgi:NAD+ kinase|nr:hypothetical protein [Ignavibacteria bacterium]